jgi:hypothetical protein
MQNKLKITILWQKDKTSWKWLTWNNSDNWNVSIKCNSKLLNKIYLYCLFIIWWAILKFFFINIAFQMLNYVTMFWSCC